MKSPIFFNHTGQRPNIHTIFGVFTGTDPDIQVPFSVFLQPLIFLSNFYTAWRVVKPEIWKNGGAFSHGR